LPDGAEARRRVNERLSDRKALLQVIRAISAFFIQKSLLIA
jgi:hypothetical protein